MRKFAAAFAAISISLTANAALIDRGEGFIYDTVLDITWAQDANISGTDNWANQMAWVDGYSQAHSVFGVFDDWRLPTTLQPALLMLRHFRYTQIHLFIQRFSRLLI